MQSNGSARFPCGFGTEKKFSVCFQTISYINLLSKCFTMYLIWVLQVCLWATVLFAHFVAHFTAGESVVQFFSLTV